MMKIILASASPRRREILERAGISFCVQPSDVEECITKKIPCQVVEELSYQKARAVAETAQEDAVVIGADTIVAFEGRILGKPWDEEEAAEMLRALQGKTHQVYTGVTVFWKGEGGREHITFHECTEVTCYPLAEEEIRAYIATGEPMDKAGSYGIQGYFSVYVKEIAGDYNNVVGLPAARLFQEMKQRGIDLRG